MNTVFRFNVGSYWHYYSSWPKLCVGHTMLQGTTICNLLVALFLHETTNVVFVLINSNITLDHRAEQPYQILNYLISICYSGQPTASCHRSKQLFSTSIKHFFTFSPCYKIVLVLTTQSKSKVNFYLLLVLQYHSSLKNVTL